MAVLTMANLDAPYTYVASEEVVSEAVKLLSIQNTAISLQQPAAPVKISQLQGLGKRVWRNVDPQQYIDSLRDEWESR